MSNKLNITVHGSNGKLGIVVSGTDPMEVATALNRVMEYTAPPTRVHRAKVAKKETK